MSIFSIINYSFFESLLSKSGVSLEEIDLADRALKIFVRDFRRLYGLEFMTINIYFLFLFYLFPNSSTNPVLGAPVTT